MSTVQLSRRGAGALTCAVLLTACGSGAASSLSSSPSASSPAPTKASSPAASSPATGSAVLSTVALTSADLTNGLTVRLADKGDSLARPTMDLCGVAFASEAQRVARREYSIVSGGQETGLGNEVVQYAGPTQAKTALREWRRAVRTCKVGSRHTTAGGDAYTVELLQQQSLTGKLPVANNSLTLMQLKVQGGRVYQVATLQQRGAYLTVVFGVFGAEPTEQQLAQVGALAGITGARLNKAVPST